jgi:hypothetical protein
VGRVTARHDEIYAHDAVKAKGHFNFEDFAAAMVFVKKFNAQPSKDVLRVLAPSGATALELQELTENGAVLV